VRETGAIIIASATTVEEALWLEAHGCDAIIAQGAEAGGHRGMFLTDDISTQVGTMALVPMVVDAVRVPVIAAGALQMGAACIDPGASAVQIGTAYLHCPEAHVPPVHRARLNEADETAITNLFTGRPARGIVNRLMREQGPIAEGIPAFPLAGGALALARGVRTLRLGRFHVAVGGSGFHPASWPVGGRIDAKTMGRCLSGFGLHRIEAEEQIRDPFGRQAGGQRANRHQPQQHP
jgi:hypothetical protein